MMTAAQALRLPSAKLSPEEERAADALETALDKFIVEHMTPEGVRFQTRETRLSVIAEVQWRIRRAGWQLTTLGLEEQSRIDRSKRIVGYGFVLAPSDEARAASQMFVASA